MDRHYRPAHHQVCHAAAMHGKHQLPDSIMVAMIAARLRNLPAASQGSPPGLFPCRRTVYASYPHDSCEMHRKEGRRAQSPLAGCTAAWHRTCRPACIGWPVPTSQNRSSLQSG